jgi:hypothetical protein
MCIDIKSRNSILTEKLHMGIDVKSRKSKLTEKLHTGMPRSECKMDS